MGEILPQLNGPLATESTFFLMKLTTRAAGSGCVKLPLLSQTAAFQLEKDGFHLEG